MTYILKTWHINLRMEWEECKRDLTDELIQRDLCQREWDAKMAEMVRIVRALISNEPLASNTLGYVTSSGAARGDESSEFDMYEERDRDSMASINNHHHHHHHENTTAASTSTPRLLSSLVGGTASLLDGAKFSPTPSAHQIAAAANKDDLRVIDMSRHKQELDTEFEQVNTLLMTHYFGFSFFGIYYEIKFKCHVLEEKINFLKFYLYNFYLYNKFLFNLRLSKIKNKYCILKKKVFKKINRVKDNYSTHKKFMDIVKS